MSVGKESCTVSFSSVWGWFTDLWVNTYVWNRIMPWQRFAGVLYLNWCFILKLQIENLSFHLLFFAIEKAEPSKLKKEI